MRATTRAGSGQPVACYRRGAQRDRSGRLAHKRSSLRSTSTPPRTDKIDRPRTTRRRKRRGGGKRRPTLERGRSSPQQRLEGPCWTNRASQGPSAPLVPSRKLAPTRADTTAVPSRIAVATLSRAMLSFWAATAAFEAFAGRLDDCAWAANAVAADAAASAPAPPKSHGAALRRAGTGTSANASGGAG